MANVPPLAENAAWSDGDFKHSRYMVKNNYIGHDEVIGNPWYTPEGLLAAQNGNVMIGGDASATDQSAIDLWMTTPFHAVGLIDPKLATVGYGSYREANSGYQMGATLDVLRGLGLLPGSVTYPIKWPSDGKTVPLKSYNGGEIPDPLTSCTGYSTPTGLPIILQAGPGNVIPVVTGSSFAQGASLLTHCVFDQTNYVNSNSSYQSLVRSILAARSAVILIPRAPLTPGATYNASLTVNAQTYSWSFSVASTVSPIPFPP